MNNSSSAPQLPPPEPATTSNNTLSSNTAPQPQVSALTQGMASNPTPTLGEYLKRKGNGEDIGWVDTREKLKNDLVTGLAARAGKLFR